MATIPKLVRKTVVAVKTETTQGSAATIAETDFMLVEGDVALKPVVEMLERNYFRTSIDPIASVAGKRLYEVTLKTELKGSGTAGTAYAPLGALVQACGFLETDGASNVVYAPTSVAITNFFGPGKSCTIEVFKDGIKHQLVGCMGNMKLTMEVNKYAYAEFTMKGVYAAPSDTAPGTTTYIAQKPAIVLGATLTLVGLATVVASKLEIDCGNEVIERPDLNAATGLKGFMITARKPTGTCDPEMETVAAHPFIANLIAGTEAATSIVVGATAGNIITLSLPKTQYMDVGYGDRNEILTGDVSLQFNQSAGDDWLTMTFT